MYYATAGKVCAITGTLTTSAAFAQASTLVSNIPAPLANNVIIWAKNNNALNSYYRLRLDSSGKINCEDAVPSGANLRIVGAYVFS